MSNYYKEDYEIDYSEISSTDEHQADFFAPSIESLKKAHDIVQRYESGRRRLEERDFKLRGAVKISPVVIDMAIAVGDNIVPLHGRVWARPSSRLLRSRYPSPPYTLSPASSARRASMRRNALRASRYVTASKPSQSAPMAPVIFDDFQRDTLERLGVMAIQGLAVAFGFIGLLVLLKVF